MSLSASFHQHTNYGGRFTSMFLPYNTEFSGIPTYASLPKSAFKAYNMDDRTSSIKVSATTANNDYGRLILFRNARYKGRFVTFQVLSGQTKEVPKLSDIDFNDRTSSALLVRHFNQECPPIPLNILFSNLGEKVSDAIYGNKGPYVFCYWPLCSPEHEIDNHYRRRSYPIHTWDMWPTFAPSETFYYLRVPMTLEMGNAKLVTPLNGLLYDTSWPDYKVEFRYWIKLYIDQFGKLRGYVHSYGAWVEGGIYTDRILENAMSRAQYEGLPIVQAEIISSLMAWEPLSFERLYYLPGSGGMGHVNDGVRLVLVTEV